MPAPASGLLARCPRALERGNSGWPHIRLGNPHVWPDGGLLRREVRCALGGLPEGRRGLQGQESPSVLLMKMDVNNIHKHFLHGPAPLGKCRTLVIKPSLNTLCLLSYLGGRIGFHFSDEESGIHRGEAVVLRLHSKGLDEPGKESDLGGSKP